MKVTNKLTTSYMAMHINIPTDKGTEHYEVEIERPDIDEGIYSVSIYDLDTDEQYLYGQFKINSDYRLLNDYELDKREHLILDFITGRLRLK